MCVLCVSVWYTACITLQHAATRCNTLLCNPLQHTAILMIRTPFRVRIAVRMFRRVLVVFHIKDLIGARAQPGVNKHALVGAAGVLHELGER
jgi:hypothetical protein